MEKISSRIFYDEDELPKERYIGPSHTSRHMSISVIVV